VKHINVSWLNMPYRSPPLYMCIRSRNSRVLNSSSLDEECLERNPLDPSRVNKKTPCNGVHSSGLRIPCTAQSTCRSRQSTLQQIGFAANSDRCGPRWRVSPRATVVIQVTPPRGAGECSWECPVPPMASPTNSMIAVRKTMPAHH